MISELVIHPNISKKLEEAIAESLNITSHILMNYDYDELYERVKKEHHIKQFKKIDDFS